MKKEFTIIIFIASVFHVFFSYSSPISPPPQELEHSDLKRPLVSITFDDGWLTDYMKAVPQLKRFGFPATFFIFTDAMGQKNRMSQDQIRNLHQSGHEIGAHTLSHANLNDLNQETIKQELEQSKKILEAIIQAPITDFAAPFGEANPYAKKMIRNYFSSNRSVEEGFNSRCKFDPYAIRVQNVTPKTTLPEFESWLDRASNKKFWLVLVYHQLDYSESPYGATPEDFEKHLNAIKQRNLEVLTIRDALAEVLPQRGICP